MSDAPALSIVIGTRNRPASLKRFCDSLAACRPAEPFELVVADASDDAGMGSRALWLITELLPQVPVTYLPETPPVGHVRGYGRAFRACRGDWVWWGNDDCQFVQPDWADVALKFMRENPKVGIGAVYFHDRLPSGGWSTVLCIQTLNQVAYANFGILRREYGDKLGWFDESLGWHYGLDTDISWRAVMDGTQVVGIPGCWVRHWREQDETRRANTSVAVAVDKAAGKKTDRQLFDERWLPLLPELQAKAREYSPGPKTVPVPTLKVAE